MTLFFVVLTACAINKEQIKQVEYIKPVVLEKPQKPEYFSVVYKKINGWYCLDVPNAKNQLKNEKLKDNYIFEYESIYEVYNAK